MDLDDVVETSDPEELAEIEAIKEAHPRKRMKLFHDDHLQGNLPPSSPDLTYASSYPSVSRLATPDTSDPVLAVKDAYENSQDPLSGLEDDFAPFVLSPLRRSETSPEKVTEIDSLVEDLTRLSPSKDLSPMQATPPQDPEPPEAVIPPEFLEHTSRYSLRRRALHQLRPYAVDQARYADALAEIPEAIVKNKRLDLTGHDRDDNYVDELSTPRRQDDDGQESGLLKDDLSSSSSEIDETRREMKRLWRETRRKDREEKSKQIAECERKRRPKPFPMSEDQPHAGPSRHTPRRPQATVSSHASPAHSPDVDDFTPRWPSPPRYDDDSVMDLTKATSPDPPSPTEDLDDIVDKEDEKTRKRLKAAKRMMPASMLKKELEKQNVDRPHRSVARQPGHDNNDDRPLLPGETRTRKASRLRDIGAVIGDSESEEHDRSTASVSADELPRLPSPSIRSPHRKRNIMRRKPAEVVPIYISSDSESQAESLDSHSDVDESSEAEESDEETFAQLFRDDGSGDLFEKILNRRYLTVSVHNSRKPTRARAGTSGLKFDVKHRAHGEKQTRLSFENHTGKSRSPSRSYQRLSRQSPVRHEQVHNFGEEDGGHVQVHLAILGGEEAWQEKKKRKEKERKLRKQTNGLHIFSTEGVRIESGRSRPAILPKERRRKKRTKTITIQLDDEGFHRAMEPRHPPPMRDYESETIVHETHHRTTGKALITNDLHITVLPLGLAFTSSTYLGKGWLRELINVSFSDQPPPLPITFAALGFDLGPHIQLMQVKTVVGDICDRAIAIATKAHEIGNEEHVKEWDGVFRVTCQLVSWHLSISSYEEGESLKQVIKDHVAGVITALRTVASTSSSINLIIIAVCWFAVELSARLGYRLPVQIPPRILVDDIFLSSTTVLVRILLVYGIHHTIAAIINRPDGRFDNSSLELRTVEVWVCIIHLTKIMFQSLGWNGKLVMHPLWQLIQCAFRTRGVLPSRALEASETYWNAIFTICALNQFSLQGMTVSNADSLLPPCWDLVTDALGHVRLDHSDADNFDARSLDQRDKYLHVITYRCLQLHSRWHWKLTNANHFITCLTALFKSRNYANLRQEKCEFPLFMRKNDLSLLEKCDARDPAFTLFMRLVVQHVKEQDSVSPTLLRKLRSNIVPVTAVYFPSKAAQPTPLAASQLANRYIANFVSLCLAPDAHSAALSAAKRFTDFQGAHGHIQCVIIRAWFMHCAFFIHNNLPLEGVTQWLDEISSCLLEDLAKSSNENPHSSHNIGLAITAIGSAMDVYKEVKTYPEPELLACISKIHRHRALPDKRFWEVQKAVQKFLDARTAAIPPPQRPPTTALPKAALPCNQESQDEYGDFDLDLNDPAIVAAFEDVPLPHLDIDQHIYQYAEPLTWYLYRAICQRLKYMSDNLDKFCDLLATWVGCVNILTVRSGPKPWSTHCFDVLKKFTASGADDFKLRVCTQTFLSMLEAVPMQYVEAEFREEFMKVFFQALVVARITIEHRYVAWILTLDGRRHPLLRDIPCEPSGGEYYISKEDFPTLRLGILRAIAGNLDHEMTAETVTKIHGMFSIMREILRSLAPEMKPAYKEFCQEVLQLFRTAIESQERLAFFRTWKP